jgi:hypothetical protein
MIKKFIGVWIKAAFIKTNEKQSLHFGKAEYFWRITVT